MDAIYARQSVDKKDSISIETQIELCQRELTHGQPCSVYFDKGFSGSNMRRPEFQRLLADVKSGRIQRIVTYRLDRISRSVLDFSNLIDFFDHYGVSFVSTQEKFDTSTPMGKAMLSITMVFAQLERETIQQRIRDNYYSRGKKGMYLGGPPPFGFVKTECRTSEGRVKHYAPNAETLPALQRIFHMYGETLHTLGEIARTLNEEGVRSPNHSLWDSSKLSRILRNPAYVRANVDVYQYYRKRGCLFANEVADFQGERGCYLYGKREGHERKYTDVTSHTLSLAPHEGVIPPALFLRCQERLDKNMQIDNRKQSQITWLTGLIKCGCCERAVVPKSSNHGRYTYLYCTGKQTTGQCETERNLGKLSDVESVIQERIFSWSGRYSSLRGSVEASENKKRNHLLVRMAEINAGIEKSLALALTSNDITGGYLSEKITQLERERHGVKEALDQLGEGRHDKLSKQIADMKHEWGNLDPRQKNTIAALLISRINLLPDKIEIEWSYDFER